MPSPNTASTPRSADARRDEEKARAKERIFSFRDEFSQWDPKMQRPEVWSLLNGRIRKGEHVRIFPLSNWTELDIWQYIAREDIELPSIYFTHRRRVVERDGMLLAVSPFIQVAESEPIVEADVRFRTVGDMTCTGGVRSSARDIGEVIREIAASRISERGETRADDRFSEAAMEDRKSEGIFHRVLAAVTGYTQANRIRARSPASVDGRLGRRWQEHAHRSAAVRNQVDLYGPARGSRARQPRAGHRLRQSRAADRRLARRA